MVKQRKTMYWKNLRKSIWKTKARFISIFSIVFLGAAFFAGLRNTPGTMQATMDNYLDHYQFADLTYMASLGFSEDDIAAICDIEGIDQLSVGYQFDARMMIGNKLSGVKVYATSSYQDDMLNHPDLKKGHFPTKDNECVIDYLLESSGIHIGDDIEITNDQGQKSFVVVGVVKDPRYTSKTDRGTNTLGDGTNSGYIEILNENNAFLAMPKALYELRDEDVLYNQICVSVEGAKDYNIFSDEYDDCIETVNTKIQSTLSLRSSSLYETLTSEASDELEKAQKKYDDGYQEYQEGKATFDEKILEAKIQIIDAKIQLNKNESEYLKAKGMANSEIDKMLATLDETSQTLKKDLEALKQQLEELKDQEITEDILEEPKEEMNDILKDIELISSLIQNASSSVDGLTQLNEAELKIQEAKLLIGQQENQLTLEELKTNRKLEEAKKQLDDAKVQLEEAKDQINHIPKGKLYSLTCHENVGVASYEINVDSISSIADIFPLLFFLVSALVSLTTMTRMVEEQRGQSGTLRALGYTKWDVMKQYIVYVIFATFFACLLGILLGTQFFPRVIVYLYNLMMFQIDWPTVIYSGNLIALQTIFISVFVTLFATVSVCMSELNLMPAILMRPKAPKLGKRILLERIQWLWKHLSFNQKVTMRNIFRYKKRFFMSVIGIAGCTALIITGIGVKYSVSQVVSRQYQDIIQYDVLARLENDVKVSEARVYQEHILDRNEVTNVEYVYNTSIQILKNKEELYGSLVVYQSMDNISNFINFKDYKTHKKIVLDADGIVISQKTAELLGTEVGDTIDIEFNDEKYNVKISHIMEYYYNNYIYMPQNLYESLTDSQLVVNNAYINMKTSSPSDRTSLENYMINHQYGNLSYSDNMGQEFSEQVRSLDIIVAILIVCAGALNFIVLFNLTNINIQERKSEIATIKVLGFRKKEVYDYIFRENEMLSVIGSILGMLFGYLLHQFIIRTVELDVTMFVRNLHWSSYIIAVAITFVFTKLINLTMRRVLNRVDMVESLKSIE